MDRRASGVALVLLSAAGFGTLGIFGRATVNADLSIATLLSYRFVLATAIVWAILYERGRLERLRGRVLLAELGLGIVYAVISIAYFESLNWLSAGIAVLLLYTYPVQVTAIGTVALDEPVTRSKVLALVCTLLGVGLVASVDATGVSGLGIALVGLASVGYAVYTLGTRAITARVSPSVHTAYVLAGIVMTVIPYGLFVGALSVPATGGAWRLVGGITLVSTIVPLLAFSEGLSRVEASSASIVSTVEPLTTVVLGVALLGETLTVSILLGGLLILAGVVLTSSLGGTVRSPRSRRADQWDSAEPETEPSSEP
jgi:drug/metabolite transporter (DMT)-like permease